MTYSIFFELLHMFNTVCCDNDLYTPYTVLIVNYNRPREMKYARRLLSTLHTVSQVKMW